MARYDWPAPFTAIHDRLFRREEHRDVFDWFSPDPLMDEILNERASYMRILADLALLAEQDHWLPLGPSTMIKGQASGDPQVAGRVRDLKVTSDGTRAYAGSANGGVWYTQDSGQSWAPLGSWGLRTDLSDASRAAHSLTIGALDVHFGASADQDVVYAATGELRPNVSSTPGAKFGGVGVLRLRGTVTSAIANPGNIPWKREATNLAGVGVYRLTHDPGADLAFDESDNNTMVAATSNGLYTRTGAFVENSEWDRVAASAPFDFDADDGVSCTDVLWTPATTSPNRDSRLWVAIMDPSGGRTDVYTSTAGPNGGFQRVSLPGRADGGRLGLAAAPAHPEIVYVLGKQANRQARVWRIDVDTDLTARVVDNVPIGLFGTVSTAGDGSLQVVSDQTNYDLAIAVDAGNPNIVYVAGSLVWSGAWNASVYKLTITGTAAADDFQTDFAPANFLDGAKDPTYIGKRAHPDVHVIVHTAPGVWIGCDGGVFAQSGGTMRPRNSGLAVAEPGYIASHPVSDGPMIAGTQDNGRIERVGDTVWRLWKKGDGGGVAYHIANPAHYVGQYADTLWAVNGGRFTQPVLRSTGSTDGMSTSEKNESDAASFYSGVAVIAGTGNKSRIAIGSHRVWFSDDWDPGGAGAMQWVTLKTGTDPRGVAPPNDSQDKLSAYGRGDWVEALKWARAGTPSGSVFDGQRLLVLTYSTVRQYSFSAGDNKWSEHNFTDEKAKNRLRTNNDISAGSLDRLPRVGRWTDIAPHDSSRGEHGSFYVSTTSSATINSSGGIDEADKMDTLWWFDGDDKWHPTGLRNAVPDATTGTGGSKAPAFAVICDPDPPHDVVYVGNAVGVWKGTLTFSGSTPSWEWRGLLHGLPQAIVQDLSIYSNGSLKLLRAALQSRGVWELDISSSRTSVGRTYFRAHNLDTRRVPLVGTLQDPLSLDASPKALDLAESPDLYAHPAGPPPAWGAGMPTEADLFDVTETLRNLAPKPRRLPMNYQVFALIHHRHIRALPGSDARVLLLQLNDAADDLGTIPLNATWRQAVMALFNGTSSSAPSGWRIADATTPIRSPSDPVDARVPRAVRFDADLTHAFNGTATQDSCLLLAVVTSSTDALEVGDLNHANLELLLRNCSHVAARRVLRRKAP